MTFTLRDLMWLMIVVAVTCSWLHDRMTQAAWFNDYYRNYYGVNR